jgi:hypothetical protein
MIQLFKGVASEADALLNDLQSSLHKQEEKLSAFAQQQREVCNLAVFLDLYVSGFWIIIIFIE